GVGALDKILGGGIQRGTCTLFLGPAGTGKSVVTSQYVAAAARRGEKAVIFAFDELRQTALARSEALGLGLQKYVDAGTVIIQQIDPAEMTAGKLSGRVLELVGTGFKLVVIDSLNGYLQAMPAERYLYLQLHEMLSFLGQLGITTIINMAQLGLVGTV